MSSTCKASRDWNQVVMDVSRIETTRDMIGDLIARGERIRETLLLKGGHAQCKCQEFQLLWIFGTDKGQVWREGRWCLDCDGALPYARAVLTSGLRVKWTS